MSTFLEYHYVLDLVKKLGVLEDGVNNPIRYLISVLIGHAWTLAAGLFGIVGGAQEVMLIVRVEENLATFGRVL